jgi:hypothetical protein
LCVLAFKIKFDDFCGIIFWRPIWSPFFMLNILVIYLFYAKGGR